jgi:hypothetical protein
MCGKSIPDYVEIFKALREEIIEEWGDVGEDKVVITDMEPAAHNGINDVFPSFIIKSCYFHMTKNIIAYAKSSTCGLTKAFDDFVFTRWLNALLGRYLFFKLIAAFI